MTFATRNFGIKSSAIAACLMLSALVTACDPAANSSPDADGNVTSEEVAEQTGAVPNENVTIRSEVQQKVGESSFTLDNDGEDILVINTSGKPFILPEDDDIEIQATGGVTNFVLVDIEREYDLD